LPEIEIRLFAGLRKYNPKDPEEQRFDKEIPPGTTVQDLIDELGIPEQKAKLIFVNNLRRDRDYEFEEGDRVGIFPPVAGG